MSIKETLIKLNDLWSEGITTKNETVILIHDYYSLENKLEKELETAIDITTIFENEFGNDIIVDIDGFYIACDDCGKYINTQIQIYGYDEKYLLGDGSIFCEKCGKSAAPKIYALSEALDIETQTGKIKETKYDSNRFIAEDKEYFVYTENEVFCEIKDEISDKIWTFKPEFIAAHIHENVKNIFHEFYNKKDERENALTLYDEILELEEEINENDLYLTKIINTDEISEINKTIEDCKKEIEQFKDQIVDLGFDRDFDEDDTTWQNEFVERLEGWGFNSEAIHLLTDNDQDIIAVIEETINQDAEACNDDLYNMIENIDEFINDVLKELGHAYFITTHKKEITIKTENESYFIFRIL